ncbi:hypothetical protein QR97_18565 [Streptomyces sp. PBH53]|nr:hypothetical protein QR97_18565 [Streptomyces sp. PBH53]
MNAACLTISRWRLIRVREMTAARMSGRHVGRDSARHGCPGRQPSPRGRSRSLPMPPLTVALIAEMTIASCGSRSL